MNYVSGFVLKGKVVVELKQIISYNIKKTLIYDLLTIIPIFIYLTTLNIRRTIVLVAIIARLYKIIVYFHKIFEANYSFIYN